MQSQTDSMEESRLQEKDFINVGSLHTGKFFVPTVFQGIYRNPPIWDVDDSELSCTRFEGVAQTTKYIAVKRFDKPFEDAKMAQRCFMELQLLRDIAHENIVKMRFAYTTAHSMEELSSVYHVTEYAGKDLRRILDQETEFNHKFTLVNFQTMISELLRALKYMISINVVLGELNPDNLAISDDGKLTLLDFGVSQAMDKTGEHNYYTGVKYYAPIETFGLSNPNKYNAKTCMWSIGAILSEMITGRILFRAEPHERNKPILKALSICGPIPENVINEQVDHEPSRLFLRDKSKIAVRIDFLQHFVESGRCWLKNEVVENGAALADFMDRTLVFDHRARLSVDEALAYPFLAAVRMPEQEVVADHPFKDVGDLQLDEYRQLIWDILKESPVRID